jgi:hypothetical protein
MIQKRSDALKNKICKTNPFPAQEKYGYDIDVQQLMPDLRDENLEARIPKRTHFFVHGVCMLWSLKVLVRFEVIFGEEHIVGAGSSGPLLDYGTNVRFHSAKDFALARRDEELIPPMARRYTSHTKNVIPEKIYTGYFDNYARIWFANIFCLTGEFGVYYLVALPVIKLDLWR